MLKRRPFSLNCKNKECKNNKKCSKIIYQWEVKGLQLLCEYGGVIKTIIKDDYKYYSQTMCEEDQLKYFKNYIKY